MDRPSPSNLRLALEPRTEENWDALAISIEPPTPSPPPLADRQLPRSPGPTTPRGSPLGSESGLRNEYPWEENEAKRYPAKDPTSLTEFERRYPPDPPGAEAGDNARVWRVYRDRVNDLDADTISGWNDAINFLLVFAGLFSAVMTAFLIDFSKKLEPDYAEYSAMALSVLVAQATGADVPGTPNLNPNSINVSNSTRAINGLWFISLTLALIVSMFAILAKQWIVMFSTRMRAPVAHMRRWAQRHRAFRDGLDKWRLNAFISALSVAMHAAVFIFLVGLVIHLHSLDTILFATVLGLTALTFGFYIASTIAPLFHGTCPTLTPLLVHSYWTIRGLFRSVGIGSQNPHAPFDESVVLGEHASDDGEQDAKVVTWMMDHLPAGHDLDSVLDALGSVDFKCSLGHFSSALSVVRSIARSRLEHLADYFSSGQVDGAELARVLRSCIYLEDGSTTWLSGLTATGNLRHIRTHDVPALSAALELQLSQTMPQQSTDENSTATAGALVVENRPPVTPRLDLLLGESDISQRRLHGRLSPLTEKSNAQISFALETWQFGRQVREVDSQMRHIFDVVSALARWNSESPSLPSPIAVQTRRIVLDKFIDAVSKTSSRLRVSQCAVLVSAFGHDASTAERCHTFITPIVRGVLKLNTKPITCDWRLQAIEVWARVFTRYDRLRGSLHGRPTRNQVWVIYSRLLQMFRLDMQWPTISSAQAVQLLQPFDATAPVETSDVLSRTGHGALNLLVHCFPLQDQEVISSSDLFARLVIRVLNQTLDLRVLNLGLCEQLVALMKRMLSGGGDHSLDISLPRGQPLSKENFGAALSKRLGNVLLPQSIRYDDVAVSKSVWNFVSEYLLASGRADALIGFASQLTVELAILGQLEIDPSNMFDELLGDGRGEALILAQEAKGRAFVIARHARWYAESWWTRAVRVLEDADWNSDTGYSSALNFIEAVQRAPPCSGCTLVVSRVVAEIQQQHPGNSITPLSHQIPASSGVSPPRTDSVAFEVFAVPSPYAGRDYTS